MQLYIEYAWMTGTAAAGAAVHAFLGRGRGKEGTLGEGRGLAKEGTEGMLW